MTVSKSLLLCAVTALVFISTTEGAKSGGQVAQAQAQQGGWEDQTDKSPTLNGVQIDAIAAQTTVVIGQDLQKGDVEARREFSPGSGVLIAKRGKTYYIATNLHVVRGRGGFYGVRTYDGEVYPVDDESTQSNIHLLGEEQGEDGETIRGFDLAIVQFTSDKEYPLATINRSSQLSQGAQAFVSGWPDPGDQSARRQRLFASGEVTNITSPAADGGYNLQYNCQTKRGMSGGPVFNAKGEVIGIHGRGGEAKSVSNLGVQVAYLMGQAQTDQPPALIPPVNNSLSNLGIQVNYLIDQAEKTQELARVLPSLEFDYPPVPNSVISNGMQNRPRSADVIDDIYKTFSRDFKHAAVRSCPSGGSGTLLLGTNEERCPD